MMKISLMGPDILRGIKQNKSDIGTFIPNFHEEFQSCIGKDSQLNLQAFDLMLQKKRIKVEQLITSSCSYSRYLGFILLLYRKDSSEKLWTAFEDPFFPIRLDIIRILTNNNRHKLFNEIFKHFTKDPRIKIRKASLIRIREDFSDLFSYRIQNLSIQDQRNIIPLLQTANSHDRKILEKFTLSDSPELSSMAVYYLMKGEPERTLSFYSRATRFFLPRYYSLYRFAQRLNPKFLKAFKYISSGDPLDLQDEFLHELSQFPPRLENRDSYIHAMELIQKRSDPFCSQRLEEYLFNSELYGMFGSELLNGFSPINQYQTFPLFLQLIKNEKEELMKQKLFSIADIFQIPLPKEYSIESL